MGKLVLLNCEQSSCKTEGWPRLPTPHPKFGRGRPMISTTESRISGLECSAPHLPQALQHEGWLPDSQCGSNQRQVLKESTQVLILAVTAPQPCFCQGRGAARNMHNMSNIASSTRKTLPPFSRFSFLPSAEASHQSNSENANAQFVKENFLARPDGDSPKRQVKGIQANTKNCRGKEIARPSFMCLLCLSQKYPAV